MGDVIELATVAIQVQDFDEEVLFSNLSINQRLADTNSFSFIWRVEQGDVLVSTQVEFYKKNLGKQVTITIDDGFVFKGVIQNILCYNHVVHNTEYEITGKGLLIKLDEIRQCRSFSKQSIKDIFQEIGGKTPMKLEPSNSEKLFYTVQYNQTDFEFLAMLAARHGEWFFYNGEQMVLAVPDKKAVELKIAEGFVFDLNISARMQQQANNIAGFDHFKGEPITSTKQAEKPGGSGMIDAAVDASKNFYGNGHAPSYYGHSVKKEILEKNSELNQQSAASSTVYVSGRTHFSGLRLGSTIKLIDENDNSAGEFIIIELYHTCIGSTNYQNHFVAIPSETKIPPYTNSHLFPYCKPQYGQVTANEDADGHARVKVHFPWQKETETTPFLNVIVPHAGDGRGFRFLPEIGDTVIVDFIDNNAERPFVMGAVFSEKSKPDVPHEGNDTKLLGTRSGRRLEINDKEGKLTLSDNFQGKFPKNALIQNNDQKDKLFFWCLSLQDERNLSVMQLNGDDSLKLGVMENDKIITEILLEKQGKKITIHSKGSINLNADGSINMNASEINMNAGGKVKINKEGIKADAMEIEMNAETNLKAAAKSNVEISAIGHTTVSATMNLELTTTGTAKLQGTLVQIN